MSGHPLRYRIRRLERHIAKAERISFGERLRLAELRRAATPPDALAEHDRTSLDAFAGREHEDNIAGRFARARLRLLAAEGEAIGPGELQEGALR